ncbi:hypothetical protein BD309DRAFT_481498 [Dichomitus squalens]|nr:hypothetical protein BD309DRAFT_481498 [Dichomitus squalens]
MQSTHWQNPRTSLLLSFAAQDASALHARAELPRRQLHCCAPHAAEHACSATKSLLYSNDQQRREGKRAQRHA